MDQNLCSSLLKWLQTFPSYGKLSPQELSDGVILGNILHVIAPEYFTEVWLGKIKTDVADNWKLKFSNLNKVYEGVMEFYSENADNLQQSVPPDLKKISEYADEKELGSLLQLVLGCAINCKNKEKHIETIMGMEEGVQTVIVNAIQDLMNREGGSSSVGSGTLEEGLPSFHPHMKSLMEQLESTSLAKEEMSRRCNEMDHQISLLAEERNVLKSENDRLMERVDILEKGGDFGSTKYTDLRKQVEGLQDELYKTESAREEYKSRVEELEKVVSEVMAKNEELQCFADEAKSLKDEVDALRGVNDKVTEYETTIETFKRRLEELSDLRRQVKILEEKNSNYMHNNLELEEEIKKTGTLRPQVEILRKQMADLHHKLAEEAKQKDKLSFENKKLAEKFETVSQERDRIMLERFELQKSLEEMKCSNSADSTSRSPPDFNDLDALEIVSPEIREKLMRLQHENRLLKKKINEKGDESTPVFESMLTDLQERFDRLQQENRGLNHRVMELESEIDESKTSSTAGLSSQKTTDSAELKKKIIDQQSRIANLEENLSKKASEMSAMEERYKRYLTKAKTVIRTLDPNQNPEISADVTALRAQLSEKDKLIENLERESEKSKEVRDIEDKLITTAFFNYGMELHRHRVNQRLSNLDPGGQTFLARQRLSSSIRPMGNVSSHRPATTSFIEDMKYS